MQTKQEAERTVIAESREEERCPRQDLLQRCGCLTYWLTDLFMFEEVTVPFT